MDDIRSVGLIVLGKKCYIDKLEGTDKDGTKQYSYHIRLKGISEDAINHYITKQQENTPDYNQWSMYTDLYKG